VKHRRFLLVIASAAKQSRDFDSEPLDCFVTEFIIGPAKGGTRWLLAMTVELMTAKTMTWKTDGRAQGRQV
jgi:hypothetical protein